MRCELSPLAEIDLREIGDYIARAARPERVGIERIIYGSRDITEDSFDHEKIIAEVDYGRAGQDWVVHTGQAVLAGLLARVIELDQPRVALLETAGQGDVTPFTVPVPMRAGGLGGAHQNCGQ